MNLKREKTEIIDLVCKGANKYSKRSDRTQSALAVQKVIAFEELQVSQSKLANILLVDLFPIHFAPLLIQ